MKEEPMITLREAAEKTGIPLRTVHHAAKVGYLATKQYGAMRLTTMANVNAWIASDKKRRGRTP